MDEITLTHIKETLSRNQSAIEELPKLKLVILRNITIEPIEAYLRYLGFQIGFNTQVKFGGFDTILQDVMSDQNGLISPEVDAILIFTRLEGLSWDLARCYPGLNEKRIKKEIARIDEFAEMTLSKIRQKSKAMILWHGFENPFSPALGIFDVQTEKGQSETIHLLNHHLRDTLNQYRSAFFVDLNSGILRMGTGQYFDNRYWHIARSPYTLKAIKEIAEEDFKFLRALQGKNKKCLVLDCDDILWGGIIGEDGLQKIKLGKNYPGSPYIEFQQEVLNLYHRGVILALCSKNNPEDVWQVFHKHPDMVLKEEQIATAQINWDDKVTNLQRIASELNIGLDSMVLVDDSEFEINLVRQQLPEVTVLYFPANSAVRFRENLISCGLFDTLTLTEEDRKRGAMYIAESKRKKLMKKVVDLDDYCRSLGMVLEVQPANEFTIPRIAQLTQKTNQFNLTTRRYSEVEIKEMSENVKSDVISLNLKDKYGDLGLIGVCILYYEKEEAFINELLLSCRALGRKVENVFLSLCLNRAKQHGCQIIKADYIPTKKNEQVKDFYSVQGFTIIGQTQDKTEYYLDLSKFSPKRTDIFKVESNL